MFHFIAPVTKRGFVQGLNIMVMNFATAITPWVFGIMSDYVGAPPAIWTCIGISFAAALINVPLMFKKGLGIPPKEVPVEAKPLKFEDKELVEKALRGELITAEDFDALNEIRRQKGKPYLIVRPGSYEADKERLDKLLVQAKDDFLYTIKQTDENITKLNRSSKRERWKSF
jgi:MFS family permease